MKDLKVTIVLILIYIVLPISLLVGYGRCIYKAVNCNYKPIGKAEVVYVSGLFIPPVGVVVGYIDVKDE
jgi:hypothetical protein